MDRFFLLLVQLDAFVSAGRKFEFIESLSSSFDDDLFLDTGIGPIVDFDFWVLSGLKLVYWWGRVANWSTELIVSLYQVGDGEDIRH